MKDKTVRICVIISAAAFLLSLAFCIFMFAVVRKYPYKDMYIRVIREIPAQGEDYKTEDVKLEVDKIIGHTVDEVVSYIGLTERKTTPEAGAWCEYVIINFEQNLFIYFDENGVATQLTTYYRL